jgi:hypothetical protein
LQEIHVLGSGIAIIRNNAGNKYLLRTDENGVLVPLGGLMAPTRQKLADITLRYRLGKTPKGLDMWLSRGHVQDFSDWFATRQDRATSIRQLVKVQLRNIVGVTETTPEEFVNFSTMRSGTQLHLLDVFSFGFTPAETRVLERAEEDSRAGLRFVTGKELIDKRTGRSEKINPTAVELLLR